MKHTKNQTNDTTANQSPKMNNYLLVKIAFDTPNQPYLSCTIRNTNY